MPTPAIQVTIVDAAGVQQTFKAGRVDLDCGCGCIDIRPGKPAFCRGFDHGVLTLDEGTSVTTIRVTQGMASLAGDAVNVICESAIMDLQDWGEHPIVAATACDEGILIPVSTLSPTVNTFPAQPAEPKQSKQHTNYHI